MQPHLTASSAPPAWCREGGMFSNHLGCCGTSARAGVSRSATLPWRMLDAFDANNIEPNLSFIGLCDGPFGEPVLLTGIAVTSGGI